MIYKFVPTVSASLLTSDAQLGLFPDVGANNWSNTGTNDRLKTEDAGEVDEFFAVEYTGAILDCSGFVLKGGSATIAETIAADATVNHVAARHAGRIDNQDAAEYSLGISYTGLRRSDTNAVGTFTPNLLTDELTPVVYGDPNTITPYDTTQYGLSLGGLTAGQMLALVRNANLRVRTVLTNEIGIVYTHYMDIFELWIDVTEATPAVTAKPRGRTRGRGRSELCAVG